jgi:hypothetical protein
MVTPISSKMAQHGSPSAAQDPDVVQLFQKLLEGEEAEEVFREFSVPALWRQARLPWLLPSRSTRQYPVLLLPQYALAAPPPVMVEARAKSHDARIFSPSNAEPVVHRAAIPPSG